MSASPSRPLPIVETPRHGSRSHATCHYRCGNACDRPAPNTSGNEHVQEVVARALGRRAVLAGAGVGAGALVLARGWSSPAAARPGSTGPGRAGTSVATDGFAPVAPNVRDTVSVPRGYETAVVISWGDPVLADAPDFDPYEQTPESAARQFGYNNDYVGVVPLDHRQSLLVTNHEYTNEELMFPADRYDPDTVRRIAMQSHGMSVVAVQRQGNGGYRPRPVRSRTARRYNRRITATTELELTGPAAGSPRLRTSQDPTGRRVLGTLNNCAGGTTPWGTVLSGEENFHQYFEQGTGNPQYAESYRRYGLPGWGSRRWDTVDRRFHLDREPHEPFRFGWIVEVDPTDPSSTPRKHTMLGRFKHEAANVVVADSGHVAAYMGDDERGDYLYKFVSEGRYDPDDRASALELLTRGTLYVARLSDEQDDPAPEYDGVGTWIPLASHEESFVPGMDVTDVLIDTRLAADQVSPTRMDRPEDVEPNPVNGRVYAALTNNDDRGSDFPADEANPITESRVRDELGAPLRTRSGNRNGYVLELTEDGGDHTGTGFTWTLLLVAGSPEAPETHFAGFPEDRVSPISCPDNVTFDSAGNLWIATDGNELGSNDGLFRVPVEGPDRGHVQQFLTVPRGAECCGPLITDDDQVVWAAPQHPGESDGSTFDDPGSTWPQQKDGEFPRPSVVVAWRQP